MIAHYFIIGVMGFLYPNDDIEWHYGV